MRMAEKGRLKLDEANNVLFTSMDGKTLKFNRGKGSALVAMDKAGKGANASALYYAMGDIVGEAPSVFSRMDGGDAMACVSIHTLIFLSL